MTATTDATRPTRQPAVRRRTPAGLWVAVALAAGALVGGAVGFATTARTEGATPTPQASASPSATLGTAAHTVATTASVAVGVPPDPRYPVAPGLDAATLAAVGDLWRLESVTTYRDDPAPGPTVVYLISPGGDRYVAGTVATKGLAVLAWDTAGDVALVGGPDFVGGYPFFRLDLATGIASAEDPPVPHESWSTSRLGVGSDGRTYFGLGSFPIGGISGTGAWAWSAAGWEELGLPAAVDPDAYYNTDAIVTGSEWMLWAEDTASYPRTEHLFNLSTGIDTPLASPGDGCSMDGWHDASHLDVWCWSPSGGAGRHRIFDVSTGTLSDAPDWSVPKDGYVYSSAQLPGTPLVFRFDDTPGYVSSISVLTKLGLKTLATVAPEDQFQIGDVIEVRPGTYVMRDGCGYTPGSEVVRAVIDAVSGFAAFGSPSDPYWGGELPAVTRSLLVNFEGE